MARSTHACVHALGLASKVCFICHQGLSVAALEALTVCWHCGSGAHRGYACVEHDGSVGVGSGGGSRMPDTSSPPKRGRGRSPVPATPSPPRYCHREPERYEACPLMQTRSSSQSRVVHVAST